LTWKGLAHHKGSAFGGISNGAGQPPQQQFENELGLAWRTTLANRQVWLEDESRQIGRSVIPVELWRQMRQAPVLFVDIPREVRVARLVEEYGRLSPEWVAGAIVKIKKRLGGGHANAALAAVQRGDARTCCDILLEHYYDKSYRHGLSKRSPEAILPLPLTSGDPVENARTILKAGVVLPHLT
jgi:tRNA 2-selenouridine synthase